MTKREAFLWIVERHLHTPYIWGGNDPWGIDCSGLAIAGLMGVGSVPWGWDATASGLLNWSKTNGFLISEENAKEGCLVFFGLPPTHVEVVWRHPDLSIGASGGGSKNVADSNFSAINLASKTDAYVKVHPWKRRPGPYTFADPFVGDA